MPTEEQLEEINGRIEWIEYGTWETSLDLSDFSIDSETLDKMMPKLKILNLTELNLSNNNLTNLPRSIGELSSLTHLIAKNNKIQDLSDTLDNLGNLERLDFTGNPLSPESARHLSHIIQTINDVTEDYEYSLNILYPDDDERAKIVKQIGASDLGSASITSEVVSDDGNIIENTVFKSSKNTIKLFLSKAPVHNEYEQKEYAPTVKMLLSQLGDPNIPIEDRNTIQVGIASALGDCGSPVKEHVIRVKIAELLKSGEKLSEENYLMIERMALIEETGKLKKLPENEKIEAVNALVSLVYSKKHIGHLAAKSKIHVNFYKGENENLSKGRDLPPISINSEYGFKILKPDVINEFIDLVTQDQIGISYTLNEGKLKELTDNYLSRNRLQNDPMAVEREKYIEKYPDDMQMFITEDSDRLDTLFSADTKETEELLNFNIHKKILRGRLKNENNEESIKQKYEEYRSEQQSKIQDFVAQKQAPQNIQAEEQEPSIENAMSDNNRYRQMVSPQIQPHTGVQRGESRSPSGSNRERSQTEAQREELRSPSGTAGHQR